MIEVITKATLTAAVHHCDRFGAESVRRSRGIDLPAREVAGRSRQSSLKPRLFPASRYSILHGLNEQSPVAGKRSVCP
ncbi:MAG: hypothetical protein OXB97_09960 [Rhodospirillales bacterium]|nr:hypothetical protein [Rhodospirillales bacterium]